MVKTYTGLGNLDQVSAQERTLLCLGTMKSLSLVTISTHLAISLALAISPRWYGWAAHKLVAQDVQGHTRLTRGMALRRTSGATSPRPAILTLRRTFQPMLSRTIPRVIRMLSQAFEFSIKLVTNLVSNCWIE